MSEIAALASNIAQYTLGTETDHQQSLNPQSGGLISAALLAVPGASSYFLGRRRRVHGPGKTEVFVGLEQGDNHGKLSPGHSSPRHRSRKIAPGILWDAIVGNRRNRRGRPHLQPIW